MEQRIKCLLVISIILLLVTPLASAFTFRFGNFAVNIGEPDRQNEQFMSPTESQEPTQTPQTVQDHTRIQDRVRTLNTEQNRACLDAGMEQHNINSILYTVNDQDYYYVRGEGLVDYYGQDADIEAAGTEEQTHQLIDMAEDGKISFFERIRITSMISKMETQGMPKLSMFGGW